MRFAELEQQYRKLEAKLVRGELSEDEFLVQVGLLRVTDEQGRRWMLSGRTGRWLLHDGQQWVFAEPPKQKRAGFEHPTVSAPQPTQADTQTTIKAPVAAPTAAPTGAAAPGGR